MGAIVSETFLPESVQLQISVVLFWIGYACVTGLLATPFAGRRTVGVWGTVTFGAMGSNLGPLILSQFLGPAEYLNPLHPLVLLTSVACCVALLWTYRVLMLRAELREKMKNAELSADSSATPDRSSSAPVLPVPAPVAPAVARGPVPTAAQRLPVQGVPAQRRPA